jgi:hypothetical protein
MRLVATASPSTSTTKLVHLVIPGSHGACT